MSAAQPKPQAARPRRQGNFAAMLRALFATLRRPPPAQAQQPAAIPPQQQPPAVKQLPAPPPRQTSLLDPPPAGSAPTDRAAFTTEFVEQFHAILKRTGVDRREPLFPVLSMLGEMLTHFTHLANDISMDFQQFRHRLDASLLAGQGNVTAAVAEAARQFDRAAAQASERMQAATAQAQQYQTQVVSRFYKDTEDLLCALVMRETGVRNWRNRIVAAATMLMVGAIGFWIGHATDHADMETRFQITDTRLAAALRRDGDEIAGQWLDLMEWNRLSQAVKTCRAVASGTGYRAACDYSFWIQAPIEEAMPQMIPEPPAR